MSLVDPITLSVGLCVRPWRHLAQNSAVPTKSALPLTSQSRRSCNRSSLLRFRFQNEAKHDSKKNSFSQLFNTQRLMNAIWHNPGASLALSDANKTAGACAVSHRAAKSTSISLSEKRQVSFCSITKSFNKTTYWGLGNHLRRCLMSRNNAEWRN